MMHGPTTPAESDRVFWVFVALVVLIFLSLGIGVTFAQTRHWRTEPVRRVPGSEHDGQLFQRDSDISGQSPFGMNGRTLYGRIAYSF